MSLGDMYPAVLTIVPPNPIFSAIVSPLPQGQGFLSPCPI